MKTNQVRQANDTETTGLIGRAMKAITDSPNTAAAYGAWTLGTVAAVALALRGQSKGERHARTISQGAISALGSHLTSTGVVVMDASSDNSAQNLAKNVATILNGFFKDTINAGNYSPCSINVEVVEGISNKFNVSVNNFFPQSFSLTSEEMKKIVNPNSNNTDIYDVIKGPLQNNGITSTFTNNSLTLTYNSTNICAV